jgi:hypothetical protein
MSRLILLPLVCCVLFGFRAIAAAQDEDTTVPALAESDGTSESAEVSSRLMEAYAAADVTSEQLEMLLPLDAEIQRAGAVKEADQMADWAARRREILSEEQLQGVRRVLRSGLGVSRAGASTVNTTGTTALDISTTASL